VRNGMKGSSVAVELAQYRIEGRRGADRADAIISVSEGMPATARLYRRYPEKDPA
jgi:hypothetical protein